MKINEKIRLMRESKKFTQAKMAEKLNMSVSGYRKIETGQSKIDHHKLERCAALFDVELIELMSLGNGRVVLLNDDNNLAIAVTGSTAEIALELQKMHLSITYKDEIIAHKERLIDAQKREILSLKTIIALMTKRCGSLHPSTTDSGNAEPEEENNSA